jgi:hypothetical protein
MNQCTTSFLVYHVCLGRREHWNFSRSFDSLDSSPKFKKSQRTVCRLDLSRSSPVSHPWKWRHKPGQGQADLISIGPLFSVSDTPDMPTLLFLTSVLKSNSYHTSALQCTSICLAKLVANIDLLGGVACIYKLRTNYVAAVTICWCSRRRVRPDPSGPSYYSCMHWRIPSL